MVTGEMKPSQSAMKQAARGACFVYSKFTITKGEAVKLRGETAGHLPSRSQFPKR